MCESVYNSNHLILSPERRNLEAHLCETVYLLVELGSFQNGVNGRHPHHCQQVTGIIFIMMTMMIMMIMIMIMNIVLMTMMVEHLIMADLIFMSRGASTAKEGERLTLKMLMVGWFCWVSR